MDRLPSHTYFWGQWNGKQGIYLEWHYCYRTSMFKRICCKIVMSNVKSNVNLLLKEDRQVVLLISSRIYHLILLLIIYPSDFENSNGSPWSLVYLPHTCYWQTWQQSLKLLAKCILWESALDLVVPGSSLVSTMHLGIKTIKHSICLLFIHNNINTFCLP